MRFAIVHTLEIPQGATELTTSQLELMSGGHQCQSKYGKYSRYGRKGRYSKYSKHNNYGKYGKYDHANNYGEDGGDY